MPIHTLTVFPAGKLAGAYAYADTIQSTQIANTHRGHSHVTVTAEDVAGGGFPVTIELDDPFAQYLIRTACDRDQAAATTLHDAREAVYRGAAGACIEALAEYLGVSESDAQTIVSEVGPRLLGEDA